MFILQAYWYFDDVTGEFFYRIKAPATSLSKVEDVHVLNMHIFHPFFADMALQADLLILHLIPDQEIWTLIHLRRQMGKKTIFEIADNVLQAGSWVEDSDALRNPWVTGHLLRHASYCDAVQFSTRHVSQTFEFLAPPHWVFENQMQTLNSQWASPETIRIGWGGSIGHRDDLLAVLPVLNGLLQRHPNVTLHVKGHLPMLERVFVGLPESQVCLEGPCSLESYLEWLENLHIGIAPLADTVFNRGRSDVKFLEYASRRMVPVLAAVGPYLEHTVAGSNAILYHSNEELGQILHDLVSDPKRLAQLSQSAYDYVAENRMMDAHALLRLDYYDKLLGGRPQTPAPAEMPDCGNLIKLLRAAFYHFDQESFEESFHGADKILNMLPSFQLAHLIRLRSLIELGLCEQAIQVYQGYQAHAVYAPLFGDALADAAKRAGQSDWRRFLNGIVDPYLASRLEASTLATSRLRLETNPFCYNSLQVLSENLTELDEVEKGRVYTNLTIYGK